MNSACTEINKFRDFYICPSVVRSGPKIPGILGPLLFISQLIAPYRKIVKHYNVTFCNNNRFVNSPLKNRRILNFETASNKNALFPERRQGAVGSDHGHSSWITASKKR